MSANSTQQCTSNENLILSSRVDKIDINKWRNFVLEHPNGNFFQSPEYFKVCKNCELYEPVLLILQRNGDIQGLLLTNIQRQFNHLLGNFTSRAVVIGGPLVKNNDSLILQSILLNYNKIIEKEVIYCQFRNTFNLESLKNVFLHCNYNYEEHLNIIVDLTKSENELWADVNNKARNRIRAARKKGVVFKVEESYNSLKECYDILKEIYARIKLPIAKFDYFKELYNITNLSNCRFLIFTIQFNNQIIGCLLGIGFKDTIYGLYNGARSEFYDKNPNDLIPWEIFLWAKEKGYKSFDWQGAGKPGIPYGVRDYKLKYGGELTNLGRFEKINKPFLYKTGKFGLKLFQNSLLTFLFQTFPEFLNYN